MPYTKFLGLVVVGLLGMIAPRAEAQTVSQSAQVVIIIPERHDKAAQPKGSALTPAPTQLTDPASQLAGAQAIVIRRGNTVSTLYTKIAE